MTRDLKYYKLKRKEEAKELELNNLYMDIALRVGLMSKDNKYKVGAVIVDGFRRNILSMGYNGTPSGTSNITRDRKGNTKREVIHAETNAICKLAQSTRTSSQSILYCTISPCFECARYIIQAGIKEVVYKDIYCKESLEFLKKANIKCVKLN